MRFWLAHLGDALARGEAAALVHVAALEGSGPREVGAQMLVTETGLFGTIGGGQLEHTATLRARECLAAGRAALQVYPLGPELNQCCGGAVTLAFEPFAPADRAWVAKLTAAASGPEPVFRTLHLDTQGEIRRRWEAGGEGENFAVSGAELGRGDPSPGPSPQAGGECVAVSIRERVNPPAPPLWLFGAGHVGRAVVQALAPLGFAITWVDGRAGVLPEPPMPGVRQLALAMPELIIDEAGPGTTFLVMTHSHSLDEAICAAVLGRGDFAYLGLIGSATKRARFAKRLAAAGIAQGQLARLVCPIGLPGIRSKEPAAIAASVAADLLIRREQAVFAAAETALHGR